MSIDMSQFYEVFFDESEELLAEAERLLLGIDIASPDAEDLNAIFRAAHSIKGGAATFGFMDMTEITHVLENLLDKIRKNEMALTAEHVDAFLSAKDVLKMELDGHRLATAVDQEQVANVKMMLKSLADAGGFEIKAAPSVASLESPAPAPVVEVAPVAEAAAEPVATATQADDGIKVFSIALPEVTEKDLNNLKEEIGLLGEVTSSKQDNGRYVFTLTTDSTQSDIISICSFILDPNDLVITQNAAKATTPATATIATPAPAATTTEDQGYGFFTDDVPAAPVAAVAVTTATEDDKQDGKVKIHEEVGYGIFAKPGEETVEEGYGFFAPFAPHKDAVKAELIGDDTPVSAEAKAADKPETKAAAPIEAAKPAATVPVASTENKTPARRESDKAPAASAETSSIRVGVEKVDQLINLSRRACDYASHD